MTVADSTIGTHTMSHALTDEDQDDNSKTTDAPDVATGGLGQLRAMAGLCNAAEFDAATNHLPLGQRRIHGDATDQAILRFAERFGPVSQMRQCWNKTYELGFNSKNKYMVRTFNLFKNDLLAETLPQAEADTFRPEDT